MTNINIPQENNIAFRYFDSEDKICLHNAVVANDIEEFLNAIQKSFIYISNMDSFAVKTFRNGIMNIKIMKKLPGGFMEKIEYEENGKIKKKTKKEIFQDNFNKIQKCNDLIFQPYSPKEKPLTPENNLNIYTGPPFKFEEKKKSMKN